MPLGFASGIWAGFGTVLTAAVSVFIFKQHLDLLAIVGIIFMVTGVVVMYLFSKSAH